MNHALIKSIAASAIVVSLVTPTLALAEVGASAQIKVNAPGIKANASGKGKLEMKPAEAGNFRVIKASTTKSTTTRATSTSNRSGKLQENTQKAIKGKINGFAVRFEKAIAIEENFAARIDTRIAKVESEGRSAADAKKYNAEAKVHIKAAKDAFVSIQQKIDIAVASSSPKAAVNDIAKQFAVVKTELKEAHKDIVAAIISLKGLGNAGVKATTTISQ